MVSIRSVSAKEGFDVMQYRLLLKIVPYHCGDEGVDRLVVSDTGASAFTIDTLQAGTA